MLLIHFSNLGLYVLGVCATSKHFWSYRTDYRHHSNIQDTQRGLLQCVLKYLFSILMFSRSQDKSSRRSLRFCQSYCGSNLSTLKFTVFQSLLLANCSVLPRTVHFQGLSCGTDCRAIFTLDSTRSIMFTFNMITNC